MLRVMFLASSLLACTKLDTFMAAPDSGAVDSDVLDASASSAADERPRTLEQREDLLFCGHAPHVDYARYLGLREGGTPREPDGRADFFLVEPAPPPAPATPILRLTLSAPRRVHAREPLPLSLRVDNPTDTARTIAAMVDGSSERWRWPVVEVYLRDAYTHAPSYVWTHDRGHSRCGNVDPRRPEDLRVIAPHGALEDPVQSSRFVPDVTIGKPGAYQLWVVYAACALPDDHDPRPASLVSGPLVSNMLRVDVLP